MILLVLPHGLPCLLPFTQATVELAVRSRRGAEGGLEVSSLIGRIHNHLSLFDFVRRINALALGTLGLWTEPLWSKGVHLLGDPSYLDTTEQYGE